MNKTCDLTRSKFVNGAREKEGEQMESDAIRKINSIKIRIWGPPN